MNIANVAVSTVLASALALGGAPAAWAVQETADEDAQAVGVDSGANAAEGQNEAVSEDGASEAVSSDAVASSDEEDASDRASEGLADVQAGLVAQDAESQAETVASLLATARTTGLVSGLSDEFKYFTKYESSCNYDQGFSSGDGYHAVGYYQFDNRYSLQPFMQFCWQYDQTTFSMFAFAMDDGLDIASMAMYDSAQGKLTEIGQQIEDAWHAAYAAAPELFAALQDTYAYENYYVVAEDYLSSRGIDISGRADCVKGLCWGLCNLFGSGGWRQFVGGYYGGVEYEGCGLSEDMSDVEFVVALTQYVIDHVAEFYPSQSAYHQGWQNRYRNEQAECLSYLPDLVDGAWYSEAVAYVKANGLMNGYGSGSPLEGRFGPEDRITRGQIATIMYRWCVDDSTDSADDDYASLGVFTDVSSSAYYAAAVNWAAESGIVQGYGDGSFRPDAYATREEVATMLAKLAASQGMATDGVDSSVLNAHVDASSVSSWAVDALAWCCQAGLVNGVGNADGTTNLAPHSSCTRAQFAKMIMVLTRDVL